MNGWFFINWVWIVVLWDEFEYWVILKNVFVCIWEFECLVWGDVDVVVSMICYLDDYDVYGE